MIREVFSFGGTLLLAGAVFLATPGISQAQRGQFGGARFGGVRFGGFRGGFYRGGYNFRPYYGGYRGWYHGGPYYRAFRPGWYRYRPYWGNYGYYPYYNSFPAYYAYSANVPVYSSYFYRSSLTDPDGATFGGSIPVSDQQSSASSLLVQNDTRAYVTVTVPEDATVWFDGSAPSARGRVRQFVTPPLEEGEQSTYWVRALWYENGQEVNQLQPVEVTAGAHIDVRFPAPPRTGR